MRLTIFNGSGRGPGGNTMVLVDAFLQGFLACEGCTAEVHHLIHENRLPEQTAAFATAEHVLLAFPMYTDMVPGLVKGFIETLAPYSGREGNPSIGYLIHCGFPEAVQLRTLERYLEKLARRLGCRHVGTLLKGNSEGLRETPPEKRTGLNASLVELGRGFAQQGEYDRGILVQLAQPERLPGSVVLLFRILGMTPLTNIGWDRSLKANGAYSRRNARPYAEK